MKLAIKRQRPVRLRTGHLGYYWRKDNAVLHMTMEGWKQLWNLDAKLRNALEDEKMLFDEKKPFRAHFTLARKAGIDADILKSWQKMNCEFEGERDYAVLQHAYIMMSIISIIFNAAL